jgi:hypothetical protein
LSGTASVQASGSDVQSAVQSAIQAASSAASTVTSTTPAPSSTPSTAAPVSSSRTRRVIDTSNKPYDISENYELYNEAKE